MSFQIRVYKSITSEQFPWDQSHFPHHTNTHHIIRYTAKFTEKPQYNPPQLSLEVSQANLTEKFIFENWVS